MTTKAYQFIIDKVTTFLFHYNSTKVKSSSTSFVGSQHLCKNISTIYWVDDVTPACPYLYSLTTQTHSTWFRQIIIISKKRIVFSKLTQSNTEHYLQVHDLGQVHRTPVRHRALTTTRHEQVCVGGLVSAWTTVATVSVPIKSA